MKYLVAASLLLMCLTASVPLLGQKACRVDVQAPRFGFVYVVSTDFAEREVPFLVGAARNLERRFRSDGMTAPSACDVAQVRAAYKAFAVELAQSPRTKKVVVDEGEEPVDDDTPIVVPKP